MREIEYIGETIQIDDYKDEHRPHNQAEHFHDIPVNPKLRDYFDATPNELREDLEVSDWWDRPFIEAYTWERMKPHNATPEEIEQRHRAWLESWPSGTRYDVRCLDGGAWDRSTWWGSAGSLEEAAAIANQGPKWRQA